MTDDRVDAGFDEWLRALVTEDSYYLECEHGHGSLPPRRVCPECASTELSEASLPSTGTVDAVTTVHVPTPAFVDDAPYTTVVVDFGPVRLTGIVVDAAPKTVEVGDDVEPSVGASETTGDEVLVFRPT
ncbi:MAG: OB-fold domain-containing protein [Halolamina sp.]|uniref:Zn-ribbon domain-containing OB-fold protein n=1 Tax=Halolamina sp. TaxID=1940283 RepID=UPI002FC27EFC